MTAPAPWYFPSELRIGPGRMAEIGAACQSAGIRAPLLVTDRALASLPVTARMLDLMEDAGMGRGIVSEAEPGQGLPVLEAAHADFRQGGHDGVIALGSGAALDLGALLVFLETQGLPVRDPARRGDSATSGHAARPVETGRKVPLVIVPTTSGIGATLGRAGLRGDAAAGDGAPPARRVFAHPAMMPKVVIADVEAGAGGAALGRAAAGMEAIARALEASLSGNAPTFARALGLEALHTARDAIAPACAGPFAPEARAAMMEAAVMAAIAAQSGLGAVDALSHAVSTLTKAHRGAACAILIPPVMRFNAPAMADSGDKMRARLGVGGGLEALLGELGTVCAELGLPHRLGELGLGPQHLDALCALALQEPELAANPRPMSAAEIRAMLQACL